mgnify:CR=1 FL=1
MRYFLAKREAGPALIVADRIDAIHEQLKREGLAEQFHPSYTRMVPAHHITELALVGCPDPSPTYTRFFTPERDALPGDLDEIEPGLAGPFQRKLDLNGPVVVSGLVDQLDFADADLLVDARAVLLSGQRGLHRTTNGYFLLFAVATVP